MIQEKTVENQQLNPWLVSVAPMIDWTDRHCRYLHRLLSRHARLYTEMITTGALLHGDVARHLRFNAQEHPVALQLGGSEPADLAACARLGEQWGYDEINLNCGCPSERVQRGAFGACLMAEPQLVADGVKAMRDAVSIPVTVKHRIGIDRVERYEFVRDFVGTVAEAGRVGRSVSRVYLANVLGSTLGPVLTGFVLMDRLGLEQVFALLPDDPPRQFRWRGRVHQVRRAEGPERIGEEWWRREIGDVSITHVRDYYRVEDQDGGRFWLFRAGLYGDPDAPAKWWLHGLFA